MLNLHIDVDLDAENPNTWGRWEVISFERDSTDYQNPDGFMKERMHLDDEPKPVCPGLREKLAHGLAFWLVKVGDEFKVQTDFTNGRRSLSGVRGLMVWQGHTLHNQRRKSADGFLDLYNQWARGEVFSWLLEDGRTGYVASCTGCWDVADMAKDIAGYLNGKAFTVEGSAAWASENLPAAIKANMVEEGVLV